MSASNQARFSYSPGDNGNWTATFSRSSTANYVGDTGDQSFVYWPGELHNTTTFARSSTANYVWENTRA